MPRYHFHIHNDVDCPDEEGQELPNLRFAIEEAKEAARGLACESISKGHLNLDHRIDIEDSDGNVLESVTFRQAFTIEG